MNRRQARRVFEAALRHMGHQNVVNTESDLDNKYHPPGISEMALHVDGNKYLHLVVVHDDMGSALRDGLNQTWTPEPSVASHLENVAAILSQTPSSAGGLTLIVVVGIGRAYEIPVLSRRPSRWSTQVCSLFDFERLQWIESDWEMMLWKISQQKKTLSSRGIEFITPDDATLYGLWLNDMYRLIPDKAIDSGPALVPVGCNEVFTLRERGRRRLDTHSVYRPDHREWVQVCRSTPVSYFKEDENRSRYASPKHGRAWIRYQLFLRWSSFPQHFCFRTDRRRLTYSFSMRSLYSAMRSLNDSIPASNGSGARCSSGLNLSAFSGVLFRALHRRCRSP